MAAGSCMAWLPMLAQASPPCLRLLVVLLFPPRAQGEGRSTLRMVRAEGQDSCCGQLDRSREGVVAAVGLVAATEASRPSGPGLAPALGDWPRRKK